MPQNQFLFVAVTFSLLFSGCTVSSDPMRTPIRKLQKGITTEDTSYVYTLPFEQGTAHTLVQGYFSNYSHKNRAALDFKMKKGTKVLAARNGVVVRIKEDGTKGGVKKKYRADGNYVIIQHEDGSRAGYWHLQHNGVLVNIGDTIQHGQVIGFSGKTGYALFPHLHFLVWRSDSSRQWKQTATRFQTSKGIVYLRPFRKYRNSK